MKNTSSFKEYSVNITLLSCSMIFGLFLVELMLSAVHEERYFVWAPHTETIFDPAPGVMPGINGKSHFSTNSEGMRGDSYSSKYDYEILAVGGSTTECLYLDQPESWPYILQEKLQRKTQSSVFVGNVGKSGRNTREHYYQIKYLLKQYPNIDMVIMLIGINDLHLVLSNPDYVPFSFNNSSQKKKVLKRAFAIHPDDRDDEVPFYKNTRVWRLLRDVKNRFIESISGGLMIQDKAGQWYDEVRKYRANAKNIIKTLPDNIHLGLSEYRRNVNEIIDIVDENGAKLVMLTQPVMWSTNGSNGYEGLLWLGGIGDFVKGKSDTYYSSQIMAEAMEVYNSELLAICDERRIGCVDLASELPKDTTTFYDDVHFNEPGARKVADVVSKYLESSDLLRH